MIFSNILIVSHSSFKLDRAQILSTRKPKKVKSYIIDFTRTYRKINHLEGLCKTLLLWRCLMEFNVGSQKIQDKTERIVIRSFFFLLKSTNIEDIELLELLRKEVNKNSVLRDMIDLRIVEFLIHDREQTLPRLKSMHYAAQSAQRLEEDLREHTDRLNGIIFKVPEPDISETRLIIFSESA